MHRFAPPEDDRNAGSLLIGVPRPRVPTLAPNPGLVRQTYCKPGGLVSVGSVDESSHPAHAPSRRFSSGEDESLLRAIAAGDTSALRALVRRYGPVALAVTSGLLRASSAQAVTTEAFRDVWRGAEAYDPSKGPVRSWLLGMVHRRAIELVREQPSKRCQPDSHMELPSDEPGLASGGTEEFGNDVGDLRTALRCLSSQQRQVVELMYFRGLTRSEVSRKLGIAPTMVSASCSSAMRQLRGVQNGTDR